MSFLKKIDYDTVIQESFLDEIIQNDYSIVERAEYRNIAKVRSYLSTSYEVDKIFNIYEDFDVAREYLDGEACWFYPAGASTGEMNVIYVAIVDTVAGTDPTDAAVWKREDVRPLDLVNILIDLVVFDLYSRIQPNDIPDLRVARYDDCMKSLKMYQFGKNAAEIPVKKTNFFLPREDVRPLNDYRF